MEQVRTPVTRTRAKKQKTEVDSKKVALKLRVEKNKTKTKPLTDEHHENKPQNVIIKDLLTRMNDAQIYGLSDFVSDVWTGELSNIINESNGLLLQRSLYLLQCLYNKPFVNVDEVKVLGQTVGKEQFEIITNTFLIDPNMVTKVLSNAIKAFFIEDEKHNKYVYVASSPGANGKVVRGVDVLFAKKEGNWAKVELGDYTYAIKIKETTEIVLFDLLRINTKMYLECKLPELNIGKWVRNFMFVIYW
ncbi:hypothetical protein EIN_046620 [Entamoeba invadens IP1]|uniref:Uncharacterized protein n=1 Tax=Entamoeba invadens IP1 TaxID=370355 RepID=A0A0A1UD90_ENTIV|nr:hypothetical protein EIN_046620 [Entamoeba invadens IP1]ELP94409.1 hypothetical protein EIN_046620 [Entamoeba invadens IP1]|eukprot:XP_004261180.1 hypothetical protein EIN_046620 [Entamoeba invadens IP1]